MMGFRRRGMLVNHLSKRHPEMPLAEVPELTLPIIKPNRDYFCQYCDKVYKSASKRKSHILKNHPGYDLPPSIRKLRLGLTGLGGGAGLPGCVTGSGGGDAEALLCTHTQLTGTVASAPVCCPHCSKQYSSKAKMVQHIRKKHTEQLLLMQQQQQQQLHHSPATTTTTTTTTSTTTTTTSTTSTTCSSSSSISSSSSSRWERPQRQVQARPLRRTKSACERSAFVRCSHSPPSTAPAPTTITTTTTPCRPLTS
ncbi:PR domain zinc finger protein 10-like [Lampetra planeri]